MPMNDPTHGDILEKLGELKGQVTTLIGLVGQKREDINALYGRVSVLEKTSTSREELTAAEKRITGLEKEIAKWAGICLATSLVLAILMPRIQQSLGVIERDTIHQQGSPGR
jgi:hypothetical protein